MRRLRDLHKKLPAWVHRALKPALRLLGTGRRHALVLLEGQERSAGKPLSIAFAGPADLKETVIKRAFAPGAVERPLGAVPVWLSSEGLAEHAPGADLVVRRVPAHYEGFREDEVLARLPAWVPMQIDLKDEACASRGKERLARLRSKARRAGFTFAISDRDAEFVEFYDRLHAPYVRDRHGEGASVQSREETLGKLRSRAWRLLTVRRGDELVAAGTVAFDGAAARFWQLGVRDGDPALLAAGAADAVYAFVMTEARERDCEVLHLGHSRPFARDGVLEYKRMLGAYVLDARDERRGSLELSLRRLTPGLADFLTENPMIAFESDGRCRLYGFVRGGRAEARKRADWWRPRYCFKDTLGLRVFTIPQAA
jgi:hypothetical protein